MGFPSFQAPIFQILVNEATNIAIPADPRILRITPLRGQTARTAVDPGICQHDQLPACGGRSSHRRQAGRPQQHALILTHGARIHHG